MIVLLPLPDAPTSATVVPDLIDRLRSVKIGASGRCARVRITCVCCYACVRIICVCCYGRFVVQFVCTNYQTESSVMAVLGWFKMHNKDYSLSPSMYVVYIYIYIYIYIILCMYMYI
jgi:hypothetical protein